MAVNYYRRRYQRRLGNAMYRGTRRALSYKGAAYLRGTRRARSMPARRTRQSVRTTKRTWARAMGATSAPSARTKFRRSRYYTGLGLRPGSNSSKRYLHEFQTTTSQDKRLQASRIIRADYDANEGVVNRRSGRICNVKGVKLRYWFALKNLAENSNIHDNPLQIRWAILNPRENTGNPTTDIDTTNFFINDGTASNEDAADFPSTGNCFKYMNRKINQRKMGVVQEGTFIIGNSTESNNSRMGIQSKKLLSLWIPVNRQMKWGSNVASDTNPSTNLYFVWWYCVEGDKDSAQRFGTGNQPMDVHYESITYFKDAAMTSGG